MTDDEPTQYPLPDVPTPHIRGNEFSSVYRLIHEDAHTARQEEARLRRALEALEARVRHIEQHFDCNHIPLDRRHARTPDRP